jgi:fructoselysine-6-P-deglycase FrlB-like protein
MPAPLSIVQYRSYIKHAPQSISVTHDTTVGLQEARQVLRTSNRIFFTGSGSSTAAAMLGVQLLVRFTNKASTFAPSSMLLDVCVLTENDAVVLISQGWSRADAVLVTQKLVQTKAKIIVITGHPERASEYTQDNHRIITLPILPIMEKIFCRPASAVTGYIKVAQLLEELTGLSYSKQQWLDAYEQGVAKPSSDIDPDVRYIVLASSLLLCAGHNIALSLREGAGRSGELHEIESYGHGFYVTDQMHASTTKYILLENTNDGYNHSAMLRILPMVKTNQNYEIWQVADDPILANVALMARAAVSVLKQIEKQEWDMNNPPGMEENRPFHVIRL